MSIENKNTTIEEHIFIQEKNILLAEFLQLQKHRVKSLYAQSNNLPEDLDAYEFDCVAYAFTELKFHKSYDWMMEVLEKIRTLKGNTNEYENGIAYTSISISFEANGIPGSASNGYKASIDGSIHYRRMINNTQHTYDKVEVPLRTKYGKDGKKVLWTALVKFVEWYNQQQK